MTDGFNLIIKIDQKERITVSLTSGNLVQVLTSLGSRIYRIINPQ